MGVIKYLSNPGQPWISSAEYPDAEPRKPTAQDTLRDLEHQMTNVNVQLDQVVHDRKELVSELVQLQARSERLKTAEKELQGKAAELAPKIEKAKVKAKAERDDRRRERQEESARQDAERRAERQAEQKQRAEERQKREEAARKILSGEPLIEGDN